MHLLIPFASSLDTTCQQLVRQASFQKKLPHLRRLLAQLHLGEQQLGDEYTLSPPHERAYAQALGWQLQDGLLPWAAWQAQQKGLGAPTDQRGWLQITPLYWHLGVDHFSVSPTQQLALTPAESKALFAAIQTLFTEYEWQIFWQDELCWYASHPELGHIPTASLDRIIGRNPDLWLPDHPQARALRSLQNEVQMVWYTHPVNEARLAAGLPIINSIWFSGSGMYQLPRLTSTEPIQMVDALRAPALAGDWTAWQRAWQDLDNGPIKVALERLQTGLPLTLTLCGERHAEKWHRLAPSWWHRLKRIGRIGRPVHLPTILNRL